MKGRILAAFAVVYLVWGSTYLGIRVAVATLPPFLLSGTRCSAQPTTAFAPATRRMPMASEASHSRRPGTGAPRTRAQA